MTNASRTPDQELTAEERDLGMDRDITRRDFLNAVALGTGAALLGRGAGLGRSGRARLAQVARDPRRGIRSRATRAVGDYARSNGNTWDVVTAGHGIRDETYGKAIASAPDTGEVYDVMIAGGGFSGTDRRVHVPQGDGPAEKRAPARQPPDHRRRGQAQRVHRPRPAAHRAAGIERRRRPRARWLGSRDMWVRHRTAAAVRVRAAAGRPQAR